MNDELDEGWDDDEDDDVSAASALDTSSPQLSELDGGWGDDEDDDEPEGDQSLAAAPGSPSAAPRTRRKKARPKRAPRDVRELRQRQAEEKREAARLAKQQQIEAKRKRKQPREKQPPREKKPKKRELRAVARPVAAGEGPEIYSPDGPADLRRDDGRVRRSSLRDARKASAPVASGLPPWVGYAVLALLVGGALLVFLLSR